MQNYSLYRKEIMQKIKMEYLKEKIEDDLMKTM
jgi:hypothetical protein